MPDQKDMKRNYTESGLNAEGIRKHLDYEKSVQLNNTYGEGDTENNNQEGKFSH